MNKERGPYIIVTDGDCHHYVIPERRDEDWNAFMASDDYEDGEVPEWADCVGGSPSLVTFESYVIG